MAGFLPSLRRVFPSRGQRRLIVTFFIPVAGRTRSWSLYGQGLPYPEQRWVAAVDPRIRSLDPPSWHRDELMCEVLSLLFIGAFFPCSLPAHEQAKIELDL